MVDFDYQLRGTGANRGPTRFMSEVSACALLLMVCLSEPTNAQCPPPSDYGFLATEGGGSTKPADVSVAIGSTFGIAISNWEVVKFDEDGVIDTVVASSWFNDLGDAVVRYDTDSGRFFVVEFQSDIGLQVSLTGSPSLAAADWHDYLWSTSFTLLHYQNLEIGDDYIYMTALVSGDANEPLVAYAPKAGLLSGTKTSLTEIQLPPFKAASISWGVSRITIGRATSATSSHPRQPVIQTVSFVSMPLIRQRHPVR